MATTTNAPIAEELAEVRDELIAHPLYAEIDSLERLRILMKHHVFAVYGFFSLAKKLQNLVTCVSVPWIPVEDGTSARLMNDIVMGEESDTDGRGGYTNHFHLYKEAMEEVGADTSWIDGYVERLRRGEDPIEAVRAAGLPENVVAFVSYDMELALNGKPHELAAAFCWGREDLIPDMFGEILPQLGFDGVSESRFKYYVERHILLDEHEHAPLARRLVKNLCAGDPVKEQEAVDAAVKALATRITLWDGVLEEIMESGF
jgi:Protein of unknown function (DUF3050)